MTGQYRDDHGSVRLALEMPKRRQRRKRAGLLRDYRAMTRRVGK